MKKRMILTAVLAAGVLAMTACGGSKTETEAADTEAVVPDDAGAAVVTEASLEDYIGLWEYNDYYLWYEIDDRYNYTIYDAHGESYEFDYEFEDGTLILEDEEGDTYMTLSFENGVLTDSEGDTLFSSELPEYYHYLGAWEYDAYYRWFDIVADGTYTSYDEDGLRAGMEDCSFEVYADGLLLLDEDGEAMLAFYPDEDDEDRMTDSDGHTLYRSELPSYAK